MGSKDDSVSLNLLKVGSAKGKGICSGKKVEWLEGQVEFEREVEVRRKAVESEGEKERKKREVEECQKTAHCELISLFFID